MGLEGKHWFALFTLSTSMVVAHQPVSGSREKRAAFVFPPSSGMGLFLAIAVPVDLPQYELSLSYNFEANYVLPDNITELELGPQITQVRFARSLTRSRVYNVLEEKLLSEGLEGRMCLLRTICETSATPVHGHNGLLGDLIHLVLTPSTSEAEDLPPEFDHAERIGKSEGKDGCERKFSECPLDLYQLFSVWDT